MATRRGGERREPAELAKLASSLSEKSDVGKKENLDIEYGYGKKIQDRRLRKNTRAADQYA